MPLFSTLPRVVCFMALLELCACVVVPIPIKVETKAHVVGVVYPTYPNPGPAPVSAKCASPARESATQAEVLALINAQRRAAGLSALRASPKLSHIAHAHACDNAARGGYSHIGSDGSDLGARLRRGGYKLSVAAENTGWGFDTAAKAVAFWMGSPHHRENILLSNVTEIGVGLADGARPAWVINFAKPR
ncbi:MAG: CAP domain-containing protein [Paracoccaceae bacterium]